MRGNMNDYRGLTRPHLADDGNRRTCWGRMSAMFVLLCVLGLSITEVVTVGEGISESAQKGPALLSTCRLHDTPRHTTTLTSGPQFPSFTWTCLSLHDDDGFPSRGPISAVHTWCLARYCVGRGRRLDGARFSCFVYPSRK